MKTITIILLLTLAGCGTKDFTRDIQTLHAIATDCAGVSTISATKTTADTRVSYVCSWEQVQL